MMALKVESLSKRFGGLHVLEDVAFSIPAGARHALLGPNGAGKTTLINVVSGWLRPDSGKIEIYGEDTTGLPVEKLVRRGLARSFQRNSAIGDLSVLENLCLASHAIMPGHANLWRDRTSYAQPIDRATETAAWMGLDKVLHRSARELSYGEKRQLEVALAMCSKPRLLLLDEPAAGTSPGERGRLRDLIKSLPPDISLVMIEHDIDLVFDVCDSATILSYGQVIAQGSREEIRKSTAVQNAYLGAAHA